MKYLKVWTSFREVISPLADAEKGRLFDMMLQYAEDGTEPGNFAGNERFTWPAAKQIIDLANDKIEKLRKNGSKGGTAKYENQQALANDSKSYQSVANDSKNQQSEATGSLNIIERNEKKSNKRESNTILPLKRFIPPTVEEIKAYCEERGSYLIDPQAFIDYYEARGWMLNNKRKMVDWKAAVRTWEHNEKERQRKEKQLYEDLPY